MFAVAGYVYMLESVFFLNVEVFGVSDSSWCKDSHLFCQKCGAYF